MPASASLPASGSSSLRERRRYHLHAGAFEPLVGIAVVIVTYNNSAETLAGCLNALAKQTLAPLRTLIIENASPGGFPEQLLNNRGNIEFISNAENVGFAAANNQAFDILRDDPRIEFVALLNPDAFPEPEWLAQLEDAARKHPDADAFASLMMVAGTQNVVDGMGDVYHVSGLAWREGHGLPLPQSGREGRDVFGVCAGAGFYRLNALQRLGGFDAHLFCYLEDVDLAFRMQRLGMKCRYVPSAIVWHVGGESTRDNLPFRLYYGHRNMILVYAKNMPSGLLLLTLPVHVTVNLLAILRSALRGDIGVVLRAQRDAIRALNRVIPQRRAIQRTATCGSRHLWRKLSWAPWRNISTRFARQPPSAGR